MEQPKETCNVGITCDIFDESFYKPIVVGPSNPSSSTSTSTSPIDDGFTCDASLMVENDLLKREVQELTLALGNAYGGETRLLKCLGSQIFANGKDGVGYTPKKGKAAFVPRKTQFVRSKDGYCHKCKQVGHQEQYCKKRMMEQHKPKLSCIRLDDCYVLTKGKKGPVVKQVCGPKEGPKKKVMWVPKCLVANLQGPK